MSKRREILVNDILTIVQEISLQIPQYDQSLQWILTEYCDTFESIKFPNDFAEACKTFDKKFRFTQVYYQMAFLWYACDFFRIIYVFLIIGKEMIGFIHKSQRKVYQNVSKQVPLNSPKEWESLQYSTHKTVIPFLHRNYGNELQILYLLNSLIDERGLGALNPKHIYDVVRPTIKKRPYRKTLHQLIESFFELSRIEWHLLFHFPAFSLSWIFIFLQINKPKEFKEFISVFSTPEANVSRSSRQYLVKNGSKGSFVGWILIPKGTSYLLSFRNFLEQGEELEIFKIVEFQVILDFKRIISYAFYTTGKGWSFESNQFKNIIRQKNPLEFIKKPTDEVFQVANKWNTDWSYLNSPNKSQMIRAFCNYWTIFSYIDLCNLAGKVSRNQDTTRLFETANASLRELFDKKVFQIIIKPQGFLRSYSFDEYLIFPPRSVTHEYLERILSIIPYSFLTILTNGQVRIFCYLDSVLIEFIERKLKWVVLPLIQLTAQPKLQLNNYDFDSGSWKEPIFCKKIKKDF